MPEITTQAYADLRNYIKNNWRYIELQNELGSKIIRISTTDNRVTSIIEANKIKITVVVKGSDPDILLGTTFTKAQLYNIAINGTPYCEETFSPFTVESDQDELTIVLTIEVHKV